LLLLADQQQEAARELRIAVELDPDAAASHYYLGTALLELHQVPPALKEFQEAVRIEPSAEHHYALAACLINMGRDREALSEIETATRLDPGKALYRARQEELLQMMRSNSASAH
jgi:tetratricopeptide (TPR) repeat protein